MNVNWTVTHAPKPGCVSVIVFSDLKRLLESIRKTGKAVFSVEKFTKTTLLICLNSSDPAVEDSFAVTHVPEGIVNLKFLARTEYSYFDYKTHHRSYFKVTKTQRLPELKRYLEAVLMEVLPDVDGIEAEIVIHDVPELA